MSLQYQAYTTPQNIHYCCCIEVNQKGNLVLGCTQDLNANNGALSLQEVYQTNGSAVASVRLYASSSFYKTMWSMDISDDEYIISGSSTSGFDGYVNKGSYDAAIFKVWLNTSSYLWVNQFGTADIDTPYTTLVQDKLVYVGGVSVSSIGFVNTLHLSNGTLYIKYSRTLSTMYDVEIDGTGLLTVGSNINNVPFMTKFWLNGTIAWDSPLLFTKGWLQTIDLAPQNYYVSGAISQGTIDGTTFSSFRQVLLRYQFNGTRSPYLIALPCQSNNCKTQDVAINDDQVVLVGTRYVTTSLYFDVYTRFYLNGTIKSVSSFNQDGVGNKLQVVQRDIWVIGYQASSFPYQGWYAVVRNEFQSAGSIAGSTSSQSTSLSQIFTSTVSVQSKLTTSSTITSSSTTLLTSSSTKTFSSTSLTSSSASSLSVTTSTSLLANLPSTLTSLQTQTQSQITTSTSTGSRSADQTFNTVLPSRTNYVTSYLQNPQTPSAGQNTAHLQPVPIHSLSVNAEDEIILTFHAGHLSKDNNGESSTMPDHLIGPSQQSQQSTGLGLVVAFVVLVLVTISLISGILYYRSKRVKKRKPDIMQMSQTQLLETEITLNNDYSAVKVEPAQLSKWSLNRQEPENERASH